MKKQNQLSRESMRKIRGGAGKSRLTPPPVPSRMAGVLFEDSPSCGMCCWDDHPSVCSACVATSAGSGCTGGASLQSCSGCKSS